MNAHAQELKVTVEAEGQKVQVLFGPDSTTIGQTVYAQSIHQDAGWYAEALDMARMKAYTEAHGKRLDTVVEEGKVFWILEDGEIVQVFNERITSRVLESLSV